MPSHYYIPHRGPRTVVELNRFGVRGVTIMGVQSLMQSELSLPKHYHKDLMEICYFVTGERLYYMDGQTSLVKSNQVFITWPGEIHWVDAAPYGKALYYYLRFTLPRRPRSFLGLSGADAGTLVEALRGMPRRHFQLDPSMHLRLGQAFTIVEAGASAETTLDLSLVLARWLFDLARQSREKSRLELSRDIADSLRIIEDDLTWLRSVDEVAERVGLSVSRFKAKFKHEIGLPPWEYILRKKFFLSRDLLKRPGMTVTRVAMELGFASSQHFASTFRRFSGSTPTAYRAGAEAGVRTLSGRVQKWLDEGVEHGYVLMEE